MSFEPHIYINYKNLETKRFDIEHKANEKWDDRDNNESKIYIELYNLLNYKNKYSKVIEFPGFSFVRIHPELSSYNQEFRDVLDELEIEYKIEI